MHFSGIPLKAPDRQDLILAPLVSVLLIAVLISVMGSSGYSWSLAGALVGGIASRVVGIDARRSIKEIAAAGVFGAFGGCAGLFAFGILG